MDAGLADPDLRASGDGRRLAASGDWTVHNAMALERIADGLLGQSARGPLSLDLTGVGRLDTVGALVLDRLRRELARLGGINFENVRPEHRTLLDAVAQEPDEYRSEHAPARPPSAVVDLLARIGHGVVEAGRDLATWTAFLGAIVLTSGRLMLNPRRIRWTPFVHHLELVGLRAVPIIVLICFLVGAIVAQQSIFQLTKFGAAIFVVDLVGILTLRELGVLLTSIMLAGRSGSAFTAEIGSMKMREEIDALRTMGLDPLEVLVMPRLLALVVSLTLLSFVAQLALLMGAGLVAWFYGGISPEIFLSRLKEALTLNSFEVGMIKAPFMGVVISLIATIEGMKVAGSAESLGLRTTSSVVKSIFMVIVLDGFFAMMFAAIGM